MATIKLGGLTLGKIAIGGSTIGDARKLSKSNMFRAEALNNHTLDKLVVNTISNNNNNDDGNQLGGNVGGNSQWLLASGYWDDNGVWDDTQNWNE